MSILEKMGLIERVPQENSGYEPEDRYEEDYTEEEEVVAESVDLVDKETLIQDIYSKNGLTDLSRSIFKAEDVIKSLPMEMATETKRNAVLGILLSFNLTATDVTEDGENRVKILKAVNKQIESDNQREIDIRTTQIEDLKRQIEDLNKEVSDLKEATSLSDSLITEEVKKVQSLVDFIIGGGK